MRINILRFVGFALIVMILFPLDARSQTPTTPAATLAQAKQKVQNLDQLLQKLNQLLQECGAIGMPTGAVQKRIQEVQRERDRWAQQVVKLGGSAEKSGNPGEGLILIGIPSGGVIRPKK